VDVVMFLVHDTNRERGDLLLAELISMRTFLREKSVMCLVMKNWMDHEFRGDAWLDTKFIKRMRVF
jgi:hypothetical protein